MIAYILFFVKAYLYFIKLCYFFAFSINPFKYFSIFSFDIINGFCSPSFRFLTFSKLAYPLSANRCAVNDTDAFLDIASFLKYSAEVLYFDTKSLSFGSPVPPQSTAVYSFL